MTFEEIDACAKALFGRDNDAAMWPYIDEGDRSYWRKKAVEEFEGTQSANKAGLMETVHLLRSPGNAARLHRSIEEAGKNKK